MDNPHPDWLEHVRQQFDYAPYPSLPLENSPRENYNDLFIHNLVTPYYLRYHRIVETAGTTILDVGCGSGYKTLILAEANPGAHIVGIDVSPASIDLSQRRLYYHGFEQAEFHCLSLEDLSTLGLKFDYINCDEILYLLPDPVTGLQAMKDVLQPEGIIRTNLHSSLQRQNFYRAQDLFRMMGLMDGNPEAFEVSVVVETMKSFKPEVQLKRQTWKPALESSDNPDEVTSEVLMNYLFQEDKGYTIPQMFSMLQAINLNFISMVNWRHWEIADVFQKSGMPERWQTMVQDASIENRLHLYELLNPVHRLLDFWCGHDNQTGSGLPVNQWDQSTWQHCIVHLHPQLQIPEIQAQAIQCIRNLVAFEMSRYIKLLTLAPVLLDSSLTAMLLPLWDGPQPMATLVDRYHKVRSLDPVTLQPISKTTAYQQVKGLLSQLEALRYVLLTSEIGR